MRGQMLELRELISQRQVLQDPTAQQLPILGGHRPGERLRILVLTILLHVFSMQQSVQQKLIWLVSRLHDLREGCGHVLIYTCEWVDQYQRFQRGRRVVHHHFLQVVQSNICPTSEAHNGVVVGIPSTT